ncbi:receptor-like serine/threonine-protein kinase SD1-8, partial [Curcuma longa]|uniref:receptor-like serine/threonine-protein kinase SD1-8 n=1 Tax=Curcuma longa TaxID=136217 RepID=UPI003D9DC84C
MTRRIPFLLYIFFNLTAVLFSLSYAGDTLTPRQPLLGAPEATLISDVNRNTNGRLVVSNNSSVVLWSSCSPVLSSPVLQLLDNGNLVVREAADIGSSRYAWQSFDFLTNTLLPGMKLGWNLMSRHNRNLMAWASISDLTEGNYSYSIDLHDDLQIFSWVGTQQQFRHGPWNDLYLSGVPEMMPYDVLEFNFVIDGEQVVFIYSVRDPSLI